MCRSRCLPIGVSQEHCTRICRVVWSHFGHMCVHLKGCSVGGHTQARVNVATATRASCLGADYWSCLGACDSSWGLCTSPWPRLWHSPWPPGAFVRCCSHHAFFPAALCNWEEEWWCCAVLHIDVAMLQVELSFSIRRWGWLCFSIHSFLLFLGWWYFFISMLLTYTVE